jgi:hypothetical protein
MQYTNKAHQHFNFTEHATEADNFQQNWVIFSAFSIAPLHISIQATK